MSNKNIIRRSATDRRQGKSDWKRIDALTDDEIERVVAGDSDVPPLVDAEWFRTAEGVMPKPKVAVPLGIFSRRISARRT